MTSQINKQVTFPIAVELLILDSSRFVATGKHADESLYGNFGASIVDLGGIRIKVQVMVALGENLRG